MIDTYCNLQTKFDVHFWIYSIMIFTWKLHRPKQNMWSEKYTPWLLYSHPLDGLESNQEEIPLFTHLIYNCIHLVCYRQFILFCLRGTQAPWFLERHQPPFRGRRKNGEFLLIIVLFSSLTLFLLLCYIQLL